MRAVNGFPAADLEFERPLGRRPPRLLLSADVNALGRIRAMWVIASSSQLAALAPVRHAIADSAPGTEH
jgi:hypothetical protein